MNRPPRQLTLDWPQAPSFAREDFLPAPSNREALKSLERWRDWPGGMLLLIGPEGAGKSHLAAVWAAAAHAMTLQADALDESALEVARAAPALAVEDADRVGANEATLFHLVNLARQNQTPLLLTARSQPERWGLKTPDLESRLRLAPIASLAAPDLELTEAVLYKLFSDRQLQVEPHVVAYIALRIERSLGAARRLVEALDREALARGRRVTRVMAGEMLRDIVHDEKPP